jgi:hypothetical protein
MSAVSVATTATAVAEQTSQPDPLAGVRIDPATVRGVEGFFRVGRSSTGRWWLIDPDGQPFLYRGVCAVNRAGAQGGRRAVPGPYAQVVDARYGYPDNPQRFVEATLQRLRAWNFNALGSWTTEEFFDRGMPYTEILEFARVGPEIRVPGVKLPDVFDPAWVAAIDEVARALCPPRRDSRWLVGYFTDNELGWGQPDTDEIWGAPDAVNRKGPTLLQACLSLPPERAAHRAAWQFVLARHDNDLKKLARAWDIDIAGKADLARLTREGRIILTKGYGADHNAFTREFTHRYVRHTAEAIRRYDPNHLILGARFGAPPGEAVLAEFKPPWVDVVSANNYRRNMYERMDTYYRVHQMPILIGEFAWASPPFTDPRLLAPAERAKPLADHLAVAGPASLEKAFTHPGIVGYTWYRWVQDPKGIVGYGLVDRRDEPVALNIRLLTEVNARLETIAAQSAAAR